MPGPSKVQIKINALRRLAKEYNIYKDEEIELQGRLTQLETHPRDEYEIRRAQQVFDETRKVKEQVAQQLKTLVGEVRKLTGLKPEEEKQVTAGLEEASAALQG
ncbi:hypothetical protein DASB73_010920 [Starmerella bacillaris]|uniref:Tubulin-specific chaperone A n=1 Tax=Starmerella bacillaris TaxID=1247836 RepID=A0AAV5RHZ1_STABA|nr:hypothetical protein DASB73_010920 [Starmerella bacillaris]